MSFVIPKTLIPILHSSPKLTSLSSFNFRPTKAMSSASAQRIFQLKFDPLSGTCEWVVVDETDDISSGISAPDLATTSYVDMLNDSWRNRAFRLAIDKTITGPCRVIDIGAGTGLLSMMSARAMGLDDHTTSGTKGTVTACESFLPMVKLMRKVLHANGMQRKVEVVNKRSDELKVGTDIDQRADVLVSEILDSELLGEGLIPTLQNAHDMLLVENPRTVPYRATIYGQLVESTFLRRLNDLYSNEAKVSDDIHLIPSGMPSPLCVKPRQYPMHCDALKEEIKLLSDPFRIFQFDFWKRPDSHGEAELLVKAIEDGRVNAIVSWWVLQLDKEGSIFYSTAPKWIKELPVECQGAGNWCDHWKQCVWFVPGEGIYVSKDDQINLQALHSDISISYEVKNQEPREKSMHDTLNGGDFQLLLTPERIAIYGDNLWRHCMLSAIRKALQGKDSPVCVVADDSIFLSAAIAHLSDKSHVVSLFPGLRETGFQYLRTVAESNGFSIDRVKVLDHRRHSLTMHDTCERKVDLLIGEPFYYGSEGFLPWQNLRFWKERTKLAGLLSENAQIIPCKGILRACAMSLPDLWRSRCSLGNIEGFDHKVANATLGACGNLPPPQEGPFLPFFIWQCGDTKELSERSTIMEFDFLSPMCSSFRKTLVELSKPGICHGFVLWIDWVMDPQSSILVSTGPDHRYWKQGVKLLSEPILVRDKNQTSCDSVEIEASFDSSNGELVIRHRFLQQKE